MVCSADRLQEQVAISSSLVGNVLTIRISERFDFSAYQEFRDSYEHLTEPPGGFVVNFIDTAYLDSSALGMLLLLRDFGGGDDAEIELINCSPDVRKILTISNFGQLFDIR